MNEWLGPRRTAASQRTYSLMTVIAKRAGVTLAGLLLLAWWSFWAVVSLALLKFFFTGAMTLVRSAFG